MYSKTIYLAAAVAIVLTATSFQPKNNGIRRSTPEKQGMSSKHLALIDSAVNATIAAGDVPGAVIDAPEDDPAEDGAPEKED